MSTLAERVAAERTAQGLPLKVEDPQALAKVCALVRPDLARRSVERQEGAA